MKNKLNKWISTLCFVLIFTMLFGIVPVYATSEGGVEVVATCSSDIKPAKGDIFVLTYRKISGTETATIEVDISTLKGGKKINLDPGDYAIESIEYKGNNQAIIDSGYGANNRIKSGHAMSGTLRILVGYTALKNYSKSYSDDFVLDENTYSDREKVKELGKFTPQWFEDNGVEMTEDDIGYFMGIDNNGHEAEDVPSEVPSETPSEIPSEEPSWGVDEPSSPQNVGGEIITETPSEVEEPVEKENNSFKMVILLGGTLIVFVGVVVVLKKKKII